MTDKEPSDKQPSFPPTPPPPQITGPPALPPIDPWTEFVLKNNDAITTIINGIVDLFAAWTKFAFNQWFIDYRKDLYRQDREKREYS